MGRLRLGILADVFGLRLQKALEMVKALGAGTVQLPVGRSGLGGLSPEDLTDTALRDIRHTIANAGLTLSGFHAEYELRLDQTGRLDELVETAREHLSLAGRLRAPVLTTSLGGLPEDASARADAVDVLRGLAETAQTHGVILALGTGRASAAELAASLDEIACGTLGANLDPGRLRLRPAAAAAEVLAEHLVHVHGTDGIAGEGLVTPGRGEVDWQELIASLESIGYTGPVILRTAPGPQAVSILREGLAFLSGL